MRRMLSLAITIPVAALIIVAIVYVVGFRKTLDAVRQAGPMAFAGVGALTAIFLVLQSAAWAALNRPIHHRVRFHTLLGAVVVGLAGNILTPSTFLGGEPLKVVYVGRTAHLPYHEVAGSVVLSKYLEAISFIFFFSFSTIVAAVSYRDVLFGPLFALGVLILVLGAVSLAFCAVLWLSLSRRWHPLAALVGWLARLPLLTGYFAGLRERAAKMEDQVSRVFCEEAAAARTAFVALFVGHVTVFLKPAAFFHLGARLDMGLGELCLIFVVGQALLAFQLTPAGAGTLDGGLIGTFALVGLSEAQAMAFLLCLRFWDAAVVGGGTILATRVGAHLISGRGPHEEEPPPRP